MQSASRHATTSMSRKAGGRAASAAMLDVLLDVRELSAASSVWGPCTAGPCTAGPSTAAATPGSTLRRDLRHTQPRRRKRRILWRERQGRWKGRGSQQTTRACISPKTALCVRHATSMPPWWPSRPGRGSSSPKTGQVRLRHKAPGGAPLVDGDQADAAAAGAVGAHGQTGGLQHKRLRLGPGHAVLELGVAKAPDVGGAGAVDGPLDGHHSAPNRQAEHLAAPDGVPAGADHGSHQPLPAVHPLILVVHLARQQAQGQRGRVTCGRRKCQGQATVCRPAGKEQQEEPRAPVASTTHLHRERGHRPHVQRAAHLHGVLVHKVPHCVWARVTQGSETGEGECC